MVTRFNEAQLDLNKAVSNFMNFLLGLYNGLYLTDALNVDSNVRSKKGPVSAFSGLLGQLQHDQSAFLRHMVESVGGTANISFTPTFTSLWCPAVLDIQKSVHGIAVHPDPQDMSWNAVEVDSDRDYGAAVDHVVGRRISDFSDKTRLPTYRTAHLEQIEFEAALEASLLGLPSRTTSEYVHDEPEAPSALDPATSSMANDPSACMKRAILSDSSGVSCAPIRKYPRRDHGHGRNSANLKSNFIGMVQLSPIKPDTEHKVQTTGDDKTVVMPAADRISPSQVLHADVWDARSLDQADVIVAPTTISPRHSTIGRNTVGSSTSYGKGLLTNPKAHTQAEVIKSAFGISADSLETVHEPTANTISYSKSGYSYLGLLFMISIF